MKLTLLLISLLLLSSFNAGLEKGSTIYILAAIGGGIILALLIRFLRNGNTGIYIENE